VSDGSLADAYSRTGAAWDAGPGRIYDRLSEELVARLPAGATGDVLDLGAGTGAASRAAAAAGARCPYASASRTMPMTIKGTLNTWPIVSHPNAM